MMAWARFGNKYALPSRFRRGWLGAVVLTLWAGAAMGQSAGKVEDRFWILWERVSFLGNQCPGGAHCQTARRYSSRPLETTNTGFIYRLFGFTDRAPNVVELPKDHPNAPRVCARNRSVSNTGFDPEALPRSEKGEVLRGVGAVHVDLTSLKSPPGFGADFGAALHEDFVAMLEAAGVRVVSKDLVHSLPGQPTLNLYFSFSDPDDLCAYEYSVFASLSQEVLLARDPRIKVAAGVWSFSTGSQAADHFGSEADAILQVAAAFVRDHRKVNGP